MMEIKYDDSQVLQTLNELRGKMGNMQKPMDKIGQHLVESTRQRFDDSVGPNGEAWPANKESTLAKMLRRNKGNRTKTGKISAAGRRKKAGSKPLIDRGYLKGGIHHRATASSVQVGSNAIQSRVMHFGAERGAFGNTRRGSPIPWGDIPARPFIGASEDDNKAILEITKAYLVP